MKLRIIKLAFGLLLSQLSLEAFTALGNAACAAEIDYQPYMKQIKARIKWNPPTKEKAEKVVVNFKINPSGSITNITISETSGDAEIDQLALKTIKNIGQLPPMPKGSAGLNYAFTLPCRKEQTTKELNAYNQELFNQILRTWWVPKDLTFKQTTLKLTVNKDGSLSAISITKSSGDAIADKLALIAAKRARPYKPLPESITNPIDFAYILGFKDSNDSNFAYWNGKRYGMGESWTTAGGSKVGHADYTTASDRQKHKAKVDALLKMNDLDDKIQKELTSGTGSASSITLASLYRQYAEELKLIEEHSQALEKQKLAYAICKLHPEAKEESAQCLAGLALTYYSLGNYQDAEPMLKEAIAIKENELNQKDKLLRELLETQAKMLFKLNKTNEANEIYKKISQTTFQ
jgi:protein TonB